MRYMAMEEVRLFLLSIPIDHGGLHNYMWEDWYSYHLSGLSKRLKANGLNGELVFLLNESDKERDKNGEAH